MQSRCRLDETCLTMQSCCSTVGLTHNDITAMLIDSVDSIEALVAYIGEDERRVRRAAISLLAN